jgi:sulfate adenylyltransferase subunit 2
LQLGPTAGDDDPLSQQSLLRRLDARQRFFEAPAHLHRIGERDARGAELIVYINKERISRGIGPLTHGSAVHTDVMKMRALKQALDEYRFDATFGGARRDEEKSRAKERIVSFRTTWHGWDPRRQRPELWRLYNTHVNEGESLRVFPLSNWTEVDVWRYIDDEKIEVPTLYFAKHRPVVERHGTLIMIDDNRLALRPEEQIQLRKVRFRTLGCYPLTGAIESDADTLEAVIAELAASRRSERPGRVIDRDRGASMEAKKREGIFDVQASRLRHVATNAKLDSIGGVRFRG